MPGFSDSRDIIRADHDLRYPGRLQFNVQSLELKFHLTFIFHRGFFLRVGE